MSIIKVKPLVIFTGVRAPAYNATDLPGRFSRGYRRSTPGFFEKGNRYSVAENLTDEANDRRTAGMINSWKVLAKNREKRRLGKKVPYKSKLKTKSVKIRLTAMKEAREIQNLARQGATAAMERLLKIVADPAAGDAAAIAAAQTIFDRAYGKASQVNLNATLDANGKTTEISSKELDTRIQTALKRVEELARGAPKAPASPQRPVDIRECDPDSGGSTKH